MPKRKHVIEESESENEMEVIPFPKETITTHHLRELSKCLNLNNLPSNIVVRQKTTNLNPDMCPFCNRAFEGSLVVECSQKGCGARYHPDCLHSLFKSNNDGSIPYHFCPACNDNLQKRLLVIRQFAGQEAYQALTTPIPIFPNTRIIVKLKLKPKSAAADVEKINAILSMHGNQITSEEDFEEQCEFLESVIASRK